jgi:hypothetical protein
MFMKQCTSCNATYADNLSKCPIDSADLTEIPPQKPKPKKSNDIWLWLTVTIGVLIVSIANSLLNKSNVTNTTTPSSADGDLNILNIALAFLLIIAGGVWWLITKTWPFILGMFVLWCIHSIIKEGVRTGVQEALSSYGTQDDLKDMIKKAIREANQPDGYDADDDF